MKSLLISGISGNMGKKLLSFSQSYDFNVVCGVDKRTFTLADCAVYPDFFEVRENIDIIIDFSSPEILNGLCEFAKLRKCPLVIGTTGYSESQENQIEKLSEFIPVCKSSNFSLGILPLIKTAKYLKDRLGNFDIALTESHRRDKKDFPSGTAKDIAKALDISQISSIRGGNVAGTHTLTFLGDCEEIEITHRTYDKGVFAKGALYCAENLIGKECGLYSVEDLYS